VGTGTAAKVSRRIAAVQLLAHAEIARVPHVSLSPAGGDPEWLRGLTGNPALPPKLAALAELNALLAHRPWLLTAAHVRALTQGVAATGGASGGGAAPPPGGDATTAFPSLKPLDSVAGATAVAASSGGTAGSSGWSLTELVHAVTIMCAYHSLCSVVQALGICR
jgi:hypothetical protein